MTGVVRSLFDGVWVRGGLRQPMGRTLPGPIAVLNVAGIDIVLTSTRHSFEDPVQLRVLGLEPLDYRIVVLKRGYLTTEFAQIAPRSILAFTPGCTNCRVAEMAFRSREPADVSAGHGRDLVAAVARTRRKKDALAGL